MGVVGLAVAKRSTDLWGYVQRALLQEVGQSAPPEPPEYYSRTVRLIAPPTIALREALTWHNPSNEAKAHAHLASMDAALEQGRTRRANRHRAAFLQALHTDRVAGARAAAGHHSLRCDPMGRGPLFDLPTAYYRDRLPWTIQPVASYRDDLLPPRAGSIVEGWNEIGEIFDRYYLADEPRTTCFPTQSLIGVIASDSKYGDWFVLDRWAS
jgi:hypothetical protein